MRLILIHIGIIFFLLVLSKITFIIFTAKEQMLLLSNNLLQK